MSEEKEQKNDVEKGKTIEELIPKEDIQIDEIDIQGVKEELQRVINKNSSEIANLKKKKEINKTNDSNPSTPRKIKYIYSNIALSS